MHTRAIPNAAFSNFRIFGKWLLLAMAGVIFFSSHAPAGTGIHPNFTAHLETGPDRRVFTCYQTRLGWHYFLETAADVAGPWTREQSPVYGAGQEIRSHIYTYPPPGPPPPPLPPDLRQHYYFNISHFFDSHPNDCLISWYHSGHS